MASEAEEKDEEAATDAMGRKIWDKDAYLEKAKQNIMFGPERIGRRKDPVIPLPSSQRTFLKRRTAELELDKNLGQMKVVTAHTIKPLQGGYWCSVCECLIKDSASYLEHVNGRRHNRNLGMNMKVEKIGVDRIKDKLKSLKQETEQAEVEDVAAKIQALEEQEEEKKKRKKEKKKRKRAAAGLDDDKEDEKEDEEKKDCEDGDGDDEEDEEMKMLRAMGLPAGFGSA
ncbi:unnamed protein product [Durusdinium trenchii]|uniref:Matrin-type domain-containing protein n=2 Tax=Durusdinium trenchii TaxID=1381693 RepID=A0ABP0IW27_9DINO